MNRFAITYLRVHRHATPLQVRFAHSKFAPGEFVELLPFEFSGIERLSWPPFGASLNNGAPGEIRTPDRPVRSRVLYPAELRARCVPRA